ncbi:MAG: replication restart helicase PriA [Phycisphaerae bacterium]
MKAPAVSAISPGISTRHYAAVAVDQALDMNLTYCIPPKLLPVLRVGSRVRVPLGRRNRPVSGTILEITDQAPACKPDTHWREKPFPQTPAEPARQDLLWNISPLEGTKNPEASNLKNILDVYPEIDPVPADLLEMARWISRYYCCPPGAVLSTIVPAAVKKNIRPPQRILIHRVDDSPELQARLTGFAARTRKAYTAVSTALANGALSPADLLAKTPVSKPMLKRFISAGLLRLEKCILWPDAARLGLPPATECSANVGPDFALTSEQAAALEALLPLLNPPRFAARLIFGVTGSGKTELYIRCIDKVIASGRQAIVLVPEISLTAQLISRFTARFARVAVLHSGMSDSLRRQHWHAIAAGWAQVIIGARSAVFAPVPKLGLIVVDEEHEPSYKQDSAPRYHARDVAVRRAQISAAPVLLGSATPSLETWRNAHVNPHYGLIKLTLRPRGLLMPKVVTVDMREERRRRRGLHALSMLLEQRLRETVADKGQAIFLLNRRGYAHYVACPKCDFVLMCDHCDATMVVHRHDAAARTASPGLPEGYIQCHYCLTNQLLPERCPECHCRLVQLGQGTQRVEEELRNKFPELRLARMDSDSMRHADAYQQTLRRFADGDLDLLLGTQMIAKGLDFPNVTLVGVLNADLAMTSPDFRASERTFQLICQVAGRCGRTRRPGLVVVQTMQPQEPAVMFATRHDYEGFVRQELEHRHSFNYPPFGRMVRLVLSDTDFLSLQGEARALLAMILESPVFRPETIRSIGPQNAPMQRLDEKYRMEIILFAAAPGPLQEVLVDLRQRGLLQRFHADVVVDVDPIAMQ